MYIIGMNEKFKILLAALFSLCVSSTVLGESINGKVVGVLDGDTIELLHGGEVKRVRLYGIDCPEKGQPYSAAAKKATSSLVAGQYVKLVVVDKDIYGRVVGKVLAQGGVYINRELVQRGLCRWYKRYASQDKDLSLAESSAKEKKLGLWSLKDIVSPWDFRKGEAKLRQGR
ncbi:MAG: nuclease [Candidatus Dadabacteria bacterium]|nr:MAG: nuclease [Candidatus Dadabacteria bacterium]